MTMNDIRKIYTQKVAELLAQGYQINPETMNGSQGEMAHISEPSPSNADQAAAR